MAKAMREQLKRGDTVSVAFTGKVIDKTGSGIRISVKDPDPGESWWAVVPLVSVRKT